MWKIPDSLRGPWTENIGNLWTNGICDAESPYLQNALCKMFRFLHMVYKPRVCGHMRHGYTCGVRRMHEDKMQKLPNFSASCCVQWLLISASLSTGVREHPVQEASGERGLLSQASVCFPCAFHSLYLSAKLETGLECPIHEGGLTIQSSNSLMIRDIQMKLQFHFISTRLANQIF